MSRPVRTRARRINADSALALLADQQASGDTVAAFARRIGIPPATLYMWRSRLGHSRPSAAKVAAPATTFVPVRLIDDACPTLPTTRYPPSFELLLDDGTTLRVPPGFEADDLARLLEVMSRC